MEVIVCQALLTCAEDTLSSIIMVNSQMLPSAQDLSGWLEANEVKSKGNSDDQLKAKAVYAEQGDGDEDNEGGDNAGEGDFPDGEDALSPEDGGDHGTNANNSNGNAKKGPGGAGGGARDENGEEEDGEGYNDDDDKNDDDDDDDNDDEGDGEDEGDEEEVVEEQPEDEEEPEEEEEAALQPPKKRKK